MLVKEKMGCMMTLVGTGENYRQNNLMSVYYWLVHCNKKVCQL